MPIAIGSKAFDPAAHLEKQGWKGKGTALKNGHLTRPLAVVHKKCLGGVGKNRDEQVPFWDNIFAATAASLSLPSSGTSTPTTSASPHGIKLADPRINKLGSWQTSGSAEASSSLTNKGKGQGQAGLSIATRVAQENARRGLYSKFFRGETLRSGGEDSDVGAGKGGAAKVETVMIAPAASQPTLSLNSTSGSASTSTSSPAPISIEETREERRARRAAKAARKLEKTSKKAEKQVKREAKAKRKAEKEEEQQQQERADILNETRNTSALEKPSENASAELPRTTHPTTGHAAVVETEKAESEDKEDERARKKRRKEEKRAKKDKT